MVTIRRIRSGDANYLENRDIFLVDVEDKVGFTKIPNYAGEAGEISHGLRR